jgi:uncharacterized protein YqfB (UPF0267 family)
MFITIKDIVGQSHVWPISLVVVFRKEDDNYYARVQYNEWDHENIQVNKDEYQRLRKIKEQEDMPLTEYRFKTAIQQLEV